MTPPSTSPEAPRHALVEPEPLVFGPPVTAGAVRDLETALALVTHQCAALVADVEATVRQASAELASATAQAELRIEAVVQRAVEAITAAVQGRGSGGGA